MKISRKHPKGHLLDTKICSSGWIVRKVDKGSEKGGKGRREDRRLLFWAEHMQDWRG